MLPVGDNSRSSRGIPPITLLLIVINVVVFLYELSLGAGVENFIRTYGAIPTEILTGRDIPPPGPRPLWIQLLTSMFIHAGWLHIIGNMAYLRVFGDDIEAAFSQGKFLLFYLVAGIFASLVQIYLSGPGDATPSVGASGAIAGVLGAYIVLFPNRQIQVLLPIPARVSAFVLLGFWFVLQFLNGITALSEGATDSGGVAVWAHIGGFLFGVVMARLLGGGMQRQIYGG